MMLVFMTLLALLITWVVWRKLSRTNLGMGARAALIILTAIVSVTGLFLVGLFLDILLAG